MAEIQESQEDAGSVDFRNLLYLLACFGIFCTFLLFGLLVFEVIRNPGWANVVSDHFAVTIGLPVAALTAVIIVSLFRTAEGPIKMHVGILKFEGASGPIVMWAMCFLVLLVGIKSLW